MYKPNSFFLPFLSSPFRSLYLLYGMMAGWLAGCCYLIMGFRKSINAIWWPATNNTLTQHTTILDWRPWLVSLSSISHTHHTQLFYVWPWLLIVVLHSFAKWRIDGYVYLRCRQSRRHNCDEWIWPSAIHIINTQECRPSPRNSHIGINGHLDDVDIRMEWHIAYFSRLLGIQHPTSYILQMSTSS